MISPLTQDDDDEEEEIPAPRRAGKGRGAGSAGQNVNPEECKQQWGIVVVSLPFKFRQAFRVSAVSTFLTPYTIIFIASWIYFLSRPTT